MNKELNNCIEYIYRRRTVAKISNDEVVSELSKYDECRFYELPEWLKTEVRNRNLSFGPREPDPFERMEATRDYKLNAYYNNQLTVDDLHNIYAKGRIYDIQC